MLGWDLEAVLLCFMFNETITVWLPQNSFPKHSSLWTRVRSSYKPHSAHFYPPSAHWLDVCLLLIQPLI